MHITNFSQSDNISGMISTIWHFGKKKIIMAIKRSVLASRGEMGKDGQSTEDFYDYKDSLYDSIILVLHVINLLFKCIGCTTPGTWGLPGGSVLRNPPANSRKHRLDPWCKRCHLTQSNWACVPQLLKPVCPRASTLATAEKPMRSSLRTARKSSPCSPQLEKSAQQRGPAQPKIINKQISMKLYKKSEP